MKFFTLSKLCVRETIALTIVAAAYIAIPAFTSAQPQPQCTAIDIKLRRNGCQEKTSVPTPRPTRPPKQTPTPKISHTPRPPQTPNVPVDQRLRVVFTTGVDAIELVSNGEVIGEKSKRGKVTAFVKEGAHDLFVKRNEEIMPDPIAVTVSPQTTAINIADKVADRLRDNVPTEPAVVTATPETGTARVAPTAAPKIVNIKTILDDYADPQKSDFIKIEDWQNVYTQCHQQLLLGVTENNIEGLCSFAQGQIELANKATIKAVMLFDSATRLMPDSPIAFYGFGNAQLVAGDNGAAVASLTRALRLDNKFALAYKKLGDVYLQQDRVKEATAQYQAAKNYGMTTPDLRLKLAVAQIKTKNCAAAVKELEELEKDAPTADLYIALSDCHTEQKRLLSAVEALNKAIALDSSSAIAYFKLGKSYFEQKEFEKAVTALERALALDPEGTTFKRKDLQESLEKARSKAKKR